MLLSVFNYLSFENCKDADAKKTSSATNQPELKKVIEAASALCTTKDFLRNDFLLLKLQFFICESL